MCLKSTKMEKPIPKKAQPCCILYSGQKRGAKKTPEILLRLQKNLHEHAPTVIVTIEVRIAGWTYSVTILQEAQTSFSFLHALVSPLHLYRGFGSGTIVKRSATEREKKERTMAEIYIQRLFNWHNWSYNHMYRASLSTIHKPTDSTTSTTQPTLLANTKKLNKHRLRRPCKHSEQKHGSHQRKTPWTLPKVIMLVKKTETTMAN